MDELERYEVYLRIAGEDDACLYVVEHWFTDRPDIETIDALFREAKQHFAILYEDVPAEDFSVEVRRLRPDDNHRPQILHAPV